MMIRITTSATLLEEYAWLKRTFHITVFFLIGFWVYFYLIEVNNPMVSPLYIAHERSFTIPDILWIVGLLLLSIYWLKANDLKGIVSTIAAGSALVFLGLIDICYNFQQGIYILSIGDGLLNSVINMLSLGYGMTLIIVGYNLILRYTKSDRTVYGE